MKDLRGYAAHAGSALYLLTAVLFFGAGALTAPHLAPRWMAWIAMAIIVAAILTLGYLVVVVLRFVRMSERRIEETYGKGPPR